MAQYHVFELTINADKSVTSVPDCESAKIFVGDIANFHSQYGRVRIDWKENVFDQPAFDGAPLNVVRAGEFNGKCTFTFADGTKLSWEGSGTNGQAEDPGGGGPG